MTAKKEREVGRMEEETVYKEQLQVRKKRKAAPLGDGNPT